MCSRAPSMKSHNIYINADAKRYSHDHMLDGFPESLHSKLPGFKSTPLRLLPSNITGVDRVYLKDESQRLGLSSFKILGASWGTFRAIIQKYNLPLCTDFDSVKATVQQYSTHLVAATDGNHGRAVAHMARLLGTKATIFVPETVDSYTREKIAGEGAAILVNQSDYDATVKSAFEYARRSSNYLLVQDTSFEGYHEIPKWIVDGYTTMLQEVEEQLNVLNLKATHIFTPVGVGSLANAVVNYSKSEGRAVSVIAVEAQAAPCLQASLRSGSTSPVPTSKTIMDGLNCGTVSDISWQTLRRGVDAAITISEHESHEAVLRLSSVGVESGPCGAAPFAALQKIIAMPEHNMINLDKDSIVVLLSTEGPRQYVVPA